MYISKYKEKFYALGILWSSSKEISKELLINISNNYNIEDIKIFDLKDRYSDFIFDCYQEDEEVMSDGYIDEKIERLLKDKNSQIVTFSIEIENPIFVFNKSNNKKQCIQARKIKEFLRNKYSGKIKEYFLDNIIHLSDNERETELLEEVFNKYNYFVIKKYERLTINCQ